MSEQTARLRQVFDDLVRFETMLWAAVDERLQAECGLSLACLNTLLIVEATPACRVQDVARSVAITVGGASQAVDRLEKSGWCVRKANPADRRSSILELTPEGEEIIRRSDPVFDEELERLLGAPLAARAFSAFSGALGTLRRAIAAPSEQK